jgi:hypothetical protein
LVSPFSVSRLTWIQIARKWSIRLTYNKELQHSTPVVHMCKHISTKHWHTRDKGGQIHCQQSTEILQLPPLETTVDRKESNLQNHPQRCQWAGNLCAPPLAPMGARTGKTNSSEGSEVHVLLHQWSLL